jgi:hypothetical protein
MFEPGMLNLAYFYALGAIDASGKHGELDAVDFAKHYVKIKKENPSVEMRDVWANYSEE